MKQNQYARMAEAVGYVMSKLRWHGCAAVNPNPFLKGEISAAAGAAHQQGG